MLWQWGKRALGHPDRSLSKISMVVNMCNNRHVLFLLCSFPITASDYRVCVMIVFNSKLNYFSVVCHRSKKHLSHVHQMLCSFVPIATSIFIFVSEPSEGLKVAYVTVFCCRRLLQSQLASGVQTQSTTLISIAGIWTQTVYPQSVKPSRVCCVSPQPPDQVPAVQHHWWRCPGGFWKCTGQGVGQGRLQRHGVYQRRSVHCGYGQHQGELVLARVGFVSVCFYFDLNILGDIDLSKSS